MAIHCITSGRLFRKRAKGVGINSGIGCCFTGFTCHPVDAPAHDCNHNYVDLNHHATSFHFHEITGSVPGFLHRFHITTLDPENSGFTRLLSETFLVSEHPPGTGVSSEEGRASDDVGLRKGARLENEPVHYPAGAQDAEYCTMPVGSASPAKKER